MNFLKSEKARAGKAISTLGAFLGVLLFSVSLFSQGSFGRILGAITDQSGGVVPGATITLIDKDRGVARTLTTDEAGVYNAPNLTPGTYTVRVEAKGFQRLDRQNVVLEVGKEVRVDLTVLPGEQSQTVTVTEAVPLVETTNATLGGTLNNADIADLPLNGRDYQNLMGLRPGVMLQPGGGPWTQSTNGVRPDESVWMVEGVFNSNPFDARPILNMPSPFMDAATILPIDAIQEFNLMENPKAEYGWKSGAVVNVGVRSGTNTLHGSAYNFYRTRQWDARNFFNVAPTNGVCQVNGQTLASSPLLFSACDQVPARFEQFGGVLGGPIKKDKLFFFAGVEGMRSLIGAAVGASAPATASQVANPPSTPNCPAGIIGDCALSMVDAIRALANAASPIPRSSISEKLLGCTESGKSPNITATCTGGLYQIASPNSKSVLSTFPNSNHSNNGIAKIDYHINDKNTVTGLFFLSDYSSVGEDHPFVATPFTDTAPIRAWTDTGAWIYTPNSRIVNEMRFGFTRTTFNFVNVDVNVLNNGSGSTYGLNTGVTNPLAGGLPSINFGGIFSPLGTASNRPQYNFGQTYDFQDGISYLKGKHALKFGGEFAHLESDTATFVQGRGLLNFSGGQLLGGNSTALEDFLAGFPSGSPAGQILTGNALRKLTWTNTAGYIQDDYRATAKLMVNLGLRYEYVSPMQEANNLWGNFDPILGMVQQGHGISSVWKGDHRAFEPRIGFAYDLTGKGTTVIRAGASVIHASWPANTFMGQFGLDNDQSTSPGAIPTAALITCLGTSKSSCPGGGNGTATSGGTNTLGVLSLASSQLCWDRAVNCPSGLATVFPSTAECGDGFPGVVNGAPNAGPCDIMGIDPNLRSPFVFNYNLSVQHQIGSNLSVEIAYVGNHGYRLLTFTDINQAPLGAGWCLNKASGGGPGSGRTTAQNADACNGLPVGTALGGFNLQAAQEARPFFTKFPYLGFINFGASRAHSRYDSAQLSVTKRMSQGLSFQVGYTYAHGFDNGSINRFGMLPQDSNNLAAENASSDFDIRHRVTFTATYNLPGIKGFGQLLEGWQINTIVNYQTAQPWEARDGVIPPGGPNNFSGTGDAADRWNLFGPASDFNSGFNSVASCFGFNGALTGNTAANVSCQIVTPYGNIVPFLSTSDTNAASAACQSHSTDGFTLGAGGCYIGRTGKGVLVPPALGSFGTAGRNIFRDSGYQNWDMSLFKNFKFRERYGVQFRWEVFNVLNHPIAGNPYGASSFGNAGNNLQGGGGGVNGLGAGLGTADFIAGNPLIGSGSERVMQLGLKLTF